MEAVLPPLDIDAPLIEARALTKQFGPRTVLDGVDFAVQVGECFGFLGPNGAGKTSTMRMIATVSPRSGGALRVLGMDPAVDGRRIRARLGVVHQDNNLDAELTVADNLMVHGRYFGLPRAEVRKRIDELLRLAQLHDRADDQVDTLSGGMKRRLTIVRALINRPDLVLLDEPTTGLDPQARHLLWERLHQLKRTGVTLVLTTHYMDEAEQLCDRLVIMDRGRITAEGSPRELIERYATKAVVELRFSTREDQGAALARLRLGGAEDGSVTTRVERTESVADRVLIYTDEGERCAAELAVAEVRAVSMQVRRSSLEDVFLTLTGRSLED